MSKIKIKGKEYRVDETKDELESKWKDGRSYIVEYYELFDEEKEEKLCLLIWSSDNFELLDDPDATTPLLIGDISDIEEIK